MNAISKAVPSIAAGRQAFDHVPGVREIYDHAASRRVIANLAQHGFDQVQSVFVSPVGLTSLLRK
jgi:hypothetical protein